MHQAIEFAIHSGTSSCTISACKTALILATVTKEQLKKKKEKSQQLVQL